MSEIIYVINLDRSNQRWLHIQKEFKDYDLIRVDATTDKDPIKGNFLSFKKVLNYAKENNLKYIIAVEDDCKLLRPIPNPEQFKMDWSIIHGGGWFHSIKATPISKDIVDTTSLYCAQLLIFNQNIYDFFIDIEEMNIPLDTVWHEKIHAIVPVPFISTQSDFISTISNKVEISRIHKIKDTEAKMIKLIKSIKRF